jgi:hypothetical protein
LALTVVLVGSVLAAMIYEMTFNYAWFRQPQKEIYMNHTMVLDAIQTVKGYIIQTNLDNGVAMHAESAPILSGDAMITSLNQLLVPEPDPAHPVLSADMTVHGGSRAQRMVVNVYDLYYFPYQLQPELLGDPAQIKDLPPPFNLLPDPSGMTYEGEKTIGDGEHSEKQESGEGGGRPDPEKYGAYLVRVRLYDGAKLTRTAEEAFLQVLSDDTP